MAGGWLKRDQNGNYLPDPSGGRDTGNVNLFLDPIQGSGRDPVARSLPRDPAIPSRGFPVPAGAGDDCCCGSSGDACSVHGPITQGGKRIGGCIPSGTPARDTVNTVSQLLSQVPDDTVGIGRGEELGYSGMAIGINPDGPATVGQFAGTTPSQGAFLVAFDNPSNFKPIRAGELLNSPCRFNRVYVKRNTSTPSDVTKTVTFDIFPVQVHYNPYQEQQTGVSPAAPTNVKVVCQVGAPNATTQLVPVNVAPAFTPILPANPNRAAFNFSAIGPAGGIVSIGIDGTIGLGHGIALTVGAAGVSDRPYRIPSAAAIVASSTVPGCQIAYFEELC